METGSFKELYSVYLKTTYDMEINGRNISKGEVVAYFDKIQLFGLTEIVNIVSARGGFNNNSRVYWETPREVQLEFTQGVFNMEQFGYMTNSRLITKSSEDIITLTETIRSETDDEGKITLKHKPNGEIFIYDHNGDKIIPYWITDNVVDTQKNNEQVLVTYNYDYSNGANILRIGTPLVSGFLELEGRTRLKDDQTGQVVTGIIKIPKLKLLSNFSIRLGRQSIPVVGKFNAVGVPVRSKEGTYVSEFYVLNDDIDSDM